jgi:hypothetical protein
VTFVRLRISTIKEQKKEKKDSSKDRISHRRDQKGKKKKEIERIRNLLTG